MYSIYKIECVCGQKYVGSTGNFNHRMSVHRSYFRIKNDKKYNHWRECCNSWEQLNIEILENIQDKKESKKREDELIIEYKCELNQNRASPISRKDYYNANIERERQYKIRRYNENKQRFLEQEKKYRDANPEKYKEKSLKYRQNNPEKIKERRKQRIDCEICGENIIKDSKARHQRSLKCKNSK